jgi:CPA2 family monovalent cation:H+ antiporter-2
MSHTALVFVELGGILLVLSLLHRLARALKQSAIPFFMTAGLFLGHGGIFPVTEANPFLELGSELGVVILLLSIGLEYSPKELFRSLNKNKSTALLDAALNAIPGAIAGYLITQNVIGAMIVAGVTWVTSSGVTVKLLGELGRMTNRETPTVISVLVLEDLAMAFYLPILSAVAVGATFINGSISVAIAIALVSGILTASYFFRKQISKLFDAENLESLIIGVSGLAILVAGFATEVMVSSAVGAFLVGISLSGKVALEAEHHLRPLRDFFGAMFFVYFGIQTNPADIAPAFLPAFALAAVTMGTKFLTGYLAAKKDGIAIPGRWRAGLALTPRGEFSIIIAAIATTATNSNAELVPFAATYVLMTVIAGPVLARIPDTAWFKQRLKARAAAK